MYNLYTEEQIYNFFINNSCIEYINSNVWTNRFYITYITLKRHIKRKYIENTLTEVYFLPVP